jgi:TM2 domain-containing membrane protein YozV
MRGTILHFSIQKNQGQISGNDGKRYQFSGAEWNLSDSPLQGTPVDFDVDGNQAISIYEDSKIPNYMNVKTSKSRILTGLLGVFVGGLGLHFFYLESWGWGVLSIIFCWTYIPAIIGFILGINYLRMSDREFQIEIKKIQEPFDFSKRNPQKK